MTVIRSSPSPQSAPSAPAAGRAALPAGEAPVAASAFSPSRNTEKARQLALLKDIQGHSYGSPMPQAQRDAHNGNVERIHQQVEAFADTLRLANPAASAQEIRDAISGNIGQIVRDAGLDLAPYRPKGDGRHAYGKYLLFTSLGLGRQLAKAPLCFQLFCFGPGQKTPIHNHPGECASLVIKGPVNERHYTGLGSRTAEKTGKEHRDDNRRAVDFAGTNAPHSIANRSRGLAYTVHAYHMDGRSSHQTVAVRDIFTAHRNPDSALYEAYEALVAQVIRGRNGSGPIAEIAAKDLLPALKESRFGANPVVLDVREPGEWRKSGRLQLDVEGVRMLHVPRGVAVATMLHDFPGRDAHVVIACRGGARSALLADELRMLGYDATSVSDGAAGCAAQGLTKPLEGSAGEAGEWHENLAGHLRCPALAAHADALRPGLESIGMAELTAGSSAGRITVFDVRQDHEQEDALPNAQRVPAGVFEKKVRFHAGFDRPVAVYSDLTGEGDRGCRAVAAARNLKEMGYIDVRYLRMEA